MGAHATSAEAVTTARLNQNFMLGLLQPLCIH
jgi:hypothetical protein